MNFISEFVCDGGKNCLSASLDAQQVERCFRQKF
jgi:hypothetical protein